jgi:hypothetical protein
MQPNNTSTNCVSTRVAPNQVNTNWSGPRKPDSSLSGTLSQETG